MDISNYEKFLEEYKSRLGDEIEGEDLGKATAVKDIMVDCVAYNEIKNYLNSLYIRKDNIHMARMFDSIVKAILSKVIKIGKWHREICDVVNSIKDAINELDIYLEKRWEKSKRKNYYKRTEIRKYLFSLEDGPDIDTSIFGWKEFIRKKLSHAKYEDSFTEEGVFSKYQTQLYLGKLPTREYVFTDNYTQDEVLDIFRETIKDIRNIPGNTIRFKRLKNPNLKLVKADLKVNREEILDKSGNFILGEDDLIEVKFKKWFVVDTLGEFFAISKGTISNKFLKELDESIQLGRTNSRGNYLIGDILKLNPDLNAKYNELIYQIYLILTVEQKMVGDQILEVINRSYKGIMFSENRFIKSEDIELKWSLKGQRKHENRLSITHQPVPNAKIYLYIDNPKNPHFRNPKTK